MSILQKSIQLGRFYFCSSPINITIVNRSNKKEIEKNNDRSNIVATPKSPILGPVTIHNPTISNKKYRWCACGLSTTQPFCDGSHEGTLFKPFRFTIEQKCDSIQLCGCKFTTNKPFCDGETCLKLQKA